MSFFCNICCMNNIELIEIIMIIIKILLSSISNACTLEPHYNTYFGVHSDISVIGSISTVGAMPVGCYKQMSAMKEGVIMRLQCTKYQGLIQDFFQGVHMESEVKLGRKHVVKG